MKKTILVVIGILVPVVLAGCSLDQTREQISNFFRSVVEQDQEHQQGFTDLTREQVYARYQVSAKGIDLSSMRLAKIPDLCSLVDEADHSKILHISLADNKIKVVDRDLSCFENLETLNLSYNNIQTIVSVGDLPNLKRLTLKKNELTSTSNLPELPSLEQLSLGYNNLKQAVDLEKYTNLKILELQHNDLEQVIGIENMNTLEQIKLEFNNLQSIEFLDALPNLELATAKGNQIADDLLEKWNQLNQQWLKNKQATGNTSVELSTGTGN